MRKKFIKAILAGTIIAAVFTPAGEASAEKKKSPRLNTSSIMLTEGMSKTIKLKKYEKLSGKKIKKVKWTSSNKKVATVKAAGKYRQNGKIAAVGAGSAKIKLKYNGKTYTCRVKVKERQYTEVPPQPVTEQPATKQPDNVQPVVEQPSTQSTPENPIPVETADAKLTMEMFETLKPDENKNIDIPEVMEYEGQYYRITALDKFRLSASDTRQVKSITIPDSVKALPDGVFMGCESLEKVTLPAGIKTIGDHAFSKCYQLKEVNIPDGTVEIGAGAFWCSGMESVTIPDSVKLLGENCFYACPNLKSVTLSKGIKDIPAGTFWGCSSLETVKMAGKLETVGDNAFCGTKVNSEDIDFSEMTFIGNSAFTSTELEYVALRAGVSIGKHAFERCSQLKSIILPEGLTEISEYMCSGCTALLNVTLPDSVNIVGNSAFKGCTSLKMVTAKTQANLLLIYPEAFSGCGEATVYLSDNALPSPDSFQDVGHLYYNGALKDSEAAPWGAKAFN